MNEIPDNAGQAPSASPPEPDRQFDLVKMFVSYQFGSLWWGRDDLIHSVQPEFVERKDRIGHPLLSVMRFAPETRQDTVPMLVGTSGTRLRESIKRHCVRVVGISEEDVGHVCFFGSILEPGLYDFEDLIDGVRHKAHAFRRPAKPVKNAAIVASEPVEWHELRVMRPNSFKPRLDAGEMEALEVFSEEVGF